MNFREQAWLIEKDGTVWPCEVIGKSTWPGCLRVLDRHGEEQHVRSFRVRAKEDVEVEWARARFYPRHA